jgi:HSP20 family protein
MAQGGTKMANLIKRDNRDVSRGSQSGSRFDPFRVMDALLRWDPAREELVAPWAGEFVPRFDVKETKDAFVIQADLPGVKEQDIEVSQRGNMLTISGKREEEQRDEGDQYYALERSYGSFSRSFTLPESADAEHVTAELKGGVLTVTVPKRPEAQPKKIAIGKGKDAPPKA